MSGENRGNVPSILEVFNKDKALVVLKPDCVKRGLVGYVISQLEQQSKIEGMKFMYLTNRHIEFLYDKYKEKSFFPRIVEFMKSGPVVVMRLSGDVLKIRDKALELREKLQQDVSENTIHASDSPEAATIELNIFLDELYDK